MNGLERRLRNVEGVADLTIELGESGLDGIRVRIDEGSDEAEVLENIRRILVAYGLRSRTAPDTGPAGLPVLDRSDDTPTTPQTEPRVSVRPSADGLAVEISDHTHSVSELGERSPVGSAETMVRAVARFRGAPPPERIAVALDELDGTRVITMLARRAGRIVVSAALGDPSLVEGLYEAADVLIDELERPFGND